MNLDLIAGGLSGIVALGAFAIHVYSSPKRGKWMTIPEYVRGGFLVTGFMFMWWSVKFVSVAGSSTPLGHINGEGIMAMGAAAYTIAALATWVVASALPDLAWGRLSWFEGFARRHQGAMPAKAEVVEAVRARGYPAVAPGEGPDAVWREGPPR